MARNYYSKPRKKSGKYAYFSNQFTKRNGECVTVKPPDRKMPCIIYPRTLNNKQYGEPYPLLFFKIRTKVKERDNYTCQICGFTSREPYKLQVHHINYDIHDSREYNLITLCNDCHLKTVTRRKNWYSVFYLKIITIYSK
jgi:hypothetical protein